MKLHEKCEYKIDLHHKFSMWWFNNENCAKKARGKSLWENYIQPINVIFIEQMKQKNRIQFVVLFKRTFELEIFFNKMLTYWKHVIWFNLKVNLFYYPWRITTFIVSCNKLQNVINHYMIIFVQKHQNKNVTLLSQLIHYKKLQYVMMSNTL